MSHVPARSRSPGATRCAGMVRRNATAEDRVFVVFRGRVYPDRPTWLIATDFLWSRFLRGLGLKVQSPSRPSQFTLLWGDGTTGYHLVTILLHATSAFLIVVALTRLAVPGALLAGFAFALHPVHVESVAWMTELKNTLSTVFYLAAALSYLRFDERRASRDWYRAAALFLLALGSKTVTATLPVALAIVIWWKRGVISWRRDLRPLVPFLLAGVAAGALTAWVEYSLIGAQGAAYELGVFDRVLLAGRAVWFYLAKLVWPVGLAFVYPKWAVGAGQWVFPVAAVGLVVGLLVTLGWK